MSLELEDDDSGQAATFNSLISLEDAEAAKTRRLRWLSQICEYWPLQRLALVTDEDIRAVFCHGRPPNDHCLDYRDAKGGLQEGKIVLTGSGPGNPDLLTMAAHRAILSADLVLADKLVPAAVMDLIPRRALVHIARKYPGNADRAQEELLELGLKGIYEGKTVIRLKQGDPYLYGRGAEEYSFFRAHGYEPIVIPGITSALSAPLFAGIPPTHRSVSDEVLICTGTGRKGAAPDPPVYASSRTVVFLMSLHRLADLVQSLLSESKGWPPSTPCAVIERASCPDQRVIRSSLEWICPAFEEEGSRPPGLLVVGRSCQVLAISQKKWTVDEGFQGFDKLQTPLERPATPG